MLPAAAVTGIVSPVTRLWSICERPWATMPSTAMRSPGRTRTRSPGWIEATGTSAVAFECLRLVGANGAVILTSVTGAKRSTLLPADLINQNLVLDNVLVLGTVNAKSDDFRQGIADLAEAEGRWPGFLGALITRRVSLADAARALSHDPSQIKTVVEMT